MSDAPAIRVVNLTCHYGHAAVLRDLDLVVPAGEFVAIMAPNGVGKSTLLKALAGIVPAWRGFIEIDGHRRRQTPESELAARQACVFLPAEDVVPIGSTSLDWVVSYARLWGVDERRALDHGRRLLELFDLDTKQRPTDGSTGQQHKVALCAALATDAKVLILDEPFGGGLDPSGISALKEVLLHATRKQGRTVVTATPVPELVEDMADRVIMLAGTGIAADGSPQQLMREVSAPTLEAAYDVLVDQAKREQQAMPTGGTRVSRYLAAEEAEQRGGRS